MNGTTNSVINNSKPNKCKQLWMLGNKHLIVIDKSIIEKLGIPENTTVFLEQDITPDHAIVMRIKKF